MAEFSYFAWLCVGGGHPAKFLKIWISPLKFKFLQILLGDKNTTYLCSKIISTLLTKHCQYICRFFKNKSLYVKCVQKKVDWAKYHNRHSSKSIWVVKLSFCQNDCLMRQSFWQKDSLITHILFELCLFRHLDQRT